VIAEQVHLVDRNATDWAAFLLGSELFKAITAANRVLARLARGIVRFVAAWRAAKSWQL